MCFSWGFGAGSYSALSIARHQWCVGSEQKLCCNEALARSRRASVNFFVGAINCHRRILFFWLPPCHWVLWSVINNMRCNEESLSNNLNLITNDHGITTACLLPSVEGACLEPWAKMQAAFRHFSRILLLHFFHSLGGVWGATDSLPDASVETTWRVELEPPCFIDLLILKTRILRPMPPHWATLKLALVHVRNPEEHQRVMRWKVRELWWDANRGCCAYASSVYCVVLASLLAGQARFGHWTLRSWICDDENFAASYWFNLQASWGIVVSHAASWSFRHQPSRKTITDSLTSRLHTFGGAFPGDVLEGLHRRDPLFLSSFLALGQFLVRGLQTGWNVRLHGFSSQQLTCSLRVFQWLSATIWITWFGWYNWQRQIKLFGWRRAIFVCPWAVAALCAGILLSFREPHFTFQEQASPF